MNLPPAALNAERLAPPESPEPREEFDPIGHQLCLLLATEVEPNEFYDAANKDVTIVRRVPFVRPDDPRPDRTAWLERCIATLDHLLRERYLWGYCALDAVGYDWFHLAVADEQDLDDLADALCSRVGVFLMNVMIRNQSFARGMSCLDTFSDGLWPAVGAHPDREVVTTKMGALNGDIFCDSNVICALVGPDFDHSTEEWRPDRLAIWVLVRSVHLHNWRGPLPSHIDGTPVLVLEATSRVHGLDDTACDDVEHWQDPTQIMIGTQIYCRCERSWKACSLGPSVSLGSRDQFFVPAHTFCDVGTPVYSGAPRSRQQIGEVIHSDHSVDVAVVQLALPIEPNIKVTADDSEMLQCNLPTDDMAELRWWGENVHKSGGSTGVTTGRLATFGLQSSPTIISLPEQPEPIANLGFVCTRARTEFNKAGDCGGPVFVEQDDGALALGIVNREITTKATKAGREFKLYGFILFSEAAKA